jgi:hypothetical protein
MVSVFASIEEDHGFVPRSGQTKDYEIGICCFSAKLNDNDSLNIGPYKKPSAFMLVDIKH